MGNFWWIDRWNEYFEDLAEAGIEVDEARRHREFAEQDAREAEDVRTGLGGWQFALDEARAGEWEGLDRMVETSLPPPSLWPTLEVFFADPPPRPRGLKPRVDKDVQTIIRRQFREWTERPLEITQPDDRVTIEPPLPPMEAYRSIAAQFSLGWETVRDIVKRRHTYAPPPKYRLPKGHVDGGEMLAKALRQAGGKCKTIPDPWNYEPHWYGKKR